MIKNFLLGLFMVFTFAGIVKAENIYTLYYFYTNVRCTTCRNFERMTTELAPNLPVEFKTINTDDKGNEHYLSDYGLYTKSVVITDNKGKYKNLEKIWNYGRDEGKFKAYITEEVNAFIEVNP